ncbi:MAG: hypothetical protein Q9225_003013 [Loekoesia sp. 1 TL-2023]
MGSPASRTLDQVLPEIEGILEVRQKLVNMESLQVTFGPEWMDGMLRIKIQELENSNNEGSTIQGLSNLGRLLDVQRNLLERNLMGLVDQMTLVIVRQKSALEAQGDASEDGASAKAPIEPVITGAIPFSEVHYGHPTPKPSSTATDDVQEGFRVVAFGVENVKFSGPGEDLCLVWKEDRNAFRCYRGRHILTQASPYLQVVPNNVTLFKCSMDSNKVLLKSSVEVQHDVPFFAQFADNEDVLEFYEVLLDKANHNIRRQLLTG